MIINKAFNHLGNFNKGRKGPLSTTGHKGHNNLIWVSENKPFLAEAKDRQKTSQTITITNITLIGKLSSVISSLLSIQIKQTASQIVLPLPAIAKTNK